MSEGKKRIRGRKKRYRVSPQHVHVKLCVHEQLYVLGGQIFYEKWLFRPQDFPCDACKNSRTVTFMRVDVLNNVVRACKHCGITEAVYARNPDTNVDQAIMLESRLVTSSSEASEIVDRTHGRKNIRFLPPKVLEMISAPPVREISESELSELEEE